MVTGINLIRDIMVDRWNRLWVASYQGVYCFFNRCFTNYKLKESNDIVRGVAVGDHDELVMGTLNGKVIVRNLQEEFTVVSDDESHYYGTSGVTIGRQVFMPSHDGVTCISLPNGEGSKDGMLRLSSLRGEIVRGLHIPQDRFRFLTKKDGRLILVSQKCVITAYDPQTEQIDTLTTDIPYPWCVAYDDKGRLYAGGTQGIYYLNDKGKAEKMEFPQKLLVTAMEADNRGNIFFASADSLFIIEKGNVRELNSQIPQLAGHEVRTLHVSPRGYLVVAVVDGLFVCQIDKDYELSNIHFYNHLNGFTMQEPLLATMAETTDGTVWLPGVEEMTSFRPEDLLAHNEEDTYIAPPLRWWQRWWVWLTGIVLLVMSVGGATRWYEKRRNLRKMIRLQSEKMQKQQQIETIRKKAKQASTNELAKDIMKMTENGNDQRLTFRTASGTIVVCVNDIAYFKGDGNYSQIVTFYDKETVLMGLGALEKMLSPDIFVRADRSTLVNIHRIYNLLPRQRRCIFRSTDGHETETTLLAPAFKRLENLI